MASTIYTQVYAPDGAWVGFFQNDKDAKTWVNKQKDSAKFEITKRPPPRKER